MNRRNFLGGMAIAPLVASAAQQAKSSGIPMDRIAVSTWSLHPMFKATRGKDVPDSAMIDLLGFFKIAHDRWGVNNFETVSLHYDSDDWEYLTDVRKAVEAVKGRIQNIPCDVRGTNLSDDDETKRQASVAAVKKWIDAAVFVGSPSVRCNTGRSKDPANLEPAIRSYTELATYAEKKKVRVIIENHGGISSDAAALMKLIKAVNKPNMGTLPDFGNFPNDEVRYPALEMMFPYARICHAKSIDFNEKGEMTTFDFHRCVALAEKAGFKGVYSVEFEGKGDPYDGVTKTIAMLRK
jgi:sugar phosphate isomerase/epimerase